MLAEMFHINQAYADARGITPENQEKIKILYSLMDTLLSMPEDMPAKDRQSVVDNIETVEFELQKLWLFPQDRNFHTYWNLIPSCSCPILDNRDNFGTNIRIINAKCKWHGSSE